MAFLELKTAILNLDRILQIRPLTNELPNVAVVHMAGEKVDAPPVLLDEADYLKLRSALGLKEEATYHE